MFRILISSMLALTTFAQLPEMSQLSDIIKDISNVQTCSDCSIDLCDETIELPNGLFVDNNPVTCEYLNNILSGMKDKLFKESKDCQKKANVYMCEAFIIPFGKITKDACENQNYDNDLLEEVYEESFCKANENCNDLSTCSMYNFDCEHDSDILPFIGESSTVFDEGDCPHSKIFERIKDFLKDNLKDIVISSVICGIFSTVLIIIIMCRKPRVIIEDRNIV